MHADGQRIEWHRDPVNVSALHVEIPPTATSLEVEFQFLSATTFDQGGYKLEYTDTPSEHHDAFQAYYEYVDLRSRPTG